MQRGDAISALSRRSRRTPSTRNRRPTTARRQRDNSDASASARVSSSVSGSDSEQPAQPVLRVCAPTHPRSTILAKPLEHGKDGIGSGSSSGSSGSADGAGGARTALFVFSCCALV